jgi:hypothetical protein
MDALKRTIDQSIKTRLANPAQRKQVVDTVLAGFEHLRKNPVPDLPERTQKLRQRVEKLAQEVAVEFSGDKLVVKVAGASESLLVELRRGTNWYAPWEEIDVIVLAAILKDPSK